jgi:ABC-type branched-subunit amino acid transport system ATPase component/ABC-type branched-subunit amino acid transport system permease subunit
MTAFDLRGRTAGRLVSAAALVACLGVLAFWPELAVGFGTQQHFYVEVATTALILTMLAISLNLAMGIAGLLSFVHTGLLAVGGYTMGVAALRWDVNPWLGMVLGIVATVLFCIVISLVSARASNIYWGLITLSFDLVLIQVLRQWNSVTGGFNGLPGVPRPRVNDMPLQVDSFYYLCLVMGVVCYVVTRNLVKSPTGRGFHALRQSPETASSLGINVPAARLLAFAIAGALAGVAGALYAMHLNFISPEVADQGPQLPLFIAIFLGGFGSLLGPVLGMVVVTVVQNELRASGENAQLILGLFLLACILILPKGIVGTWMSTKFGRWVSAAGQPAAFVPEDAVLPELTMAAPDDREPVMVCRDLGKQYGGVRALGGVDLDLRPGEIHGLIGPNGAGKSTLASCITAHIQRDSGTVAIDGRPLPSRPHAVARRGVTRVFQEPHLFEGGTVEDNVLTGMYGSAPSGWLPAILRTPGYLKAERRRRQQARLLLRAVGLEDLVHTPASSLSHGQKRLVEVVRAVATHPRVLILDEPATGLTPTDLTQLERLLRTLAGFGIALLLIEHNMGFVLPLCDRLTVLNFGEVIARGTPQEIVESVVVREAYLGGTTV